MLKTFILFYENIKCLSIVIVLLFVRQNRIHLHIINKVINTCENLSTLITKLEGIICSHKQRNLCDHDATKYSRYFECANMLLLMADNVKEVSIKIYMEVYLEYKSRSRNEE